MARAVLEILGDASGVTRMFADVVAASRKASASVAADWRGAGMAGVREARASTQAVARGEADKAKAAERSARARENAEKRVSTVAKAEGNYRTNQNKSEADKAIKEAERVQRAREKAEKDATRASIRAASVRSSLDRQRAREAAETARQTERAERRASARRDRIGGAVRSAVAGGVSRGVGVLEGANARALGARETYASTERVLNRALYQTSGDNREIAQARNELLAFAHARNMDPAELAQAAAAAQGEFSALGTRQMNAAQRAQARAAFLGNVGEAQNMGQDVGEFSRLAGALSSSGLDTRSQRAAMRSLTGISMRGSVELGNLTREALQPMMAAIARSTGQLGANASEAQRQAAVRSAVTESVAAMEVLQPLGIGPRRGGNALNAAATALTGERAQHNLLRHVRHEFGANSELERRMFERDRSGRSRLRGEYTDVYRFGETISGALGGDQDRIRNFLGTGRDREGHVLAQTLTQPERDALAALAGRGEGGKTGYERIRDIREGAEVTQRDVAQGEELFMGQEASKLQAERNAELMNYLNPVVQRQAQNVSAFERQHPLLNAGIGVLPESVGGFIRQMVGGMATGAEAAAGTIPQGQAAQMPRTFANGLPVTLSPESISRLAETLRNAPLTANVAPQAAEHAAARIATRPPSAPAGEH